MAKNEVSETIVSAGMRIDGDLKSNGSIRIDGIVSGKVTTSQDLTVGTGAQIDADVLALNATIAGIIKGNVTIKNSLNILETGKILGNISCASLSIREGGFFNGNCLMREARPENKQESKDLRN